MAINKSLRKAKEAKNDEFYTQYKDIAEELKHYKPYFKDKVVYCNCDNPEESNFWKYFYLNFEDLGLKKLISTYYEKGDNAKSYKTIYDGIEIEIKELKGNGDFRSEECIELLKDTDIVVTNPPFSLFREFLHSLVENNCDFILIGNTNALVYSEVFELFQKDKIRTGYTNFNVGMYFRVPKDYKYTKEIEGEHFARVSTSCWYTSLMVEKHKESLALTKKYNAKDYPKYHNYDAINVNNFNEIPCDYEGLMGVPMTFLDKFNAKQFDLVGLSSKNHSKNVPRLHDNDYYKGYTRGKVVTRVESNMPLLETSDFGGTKCTKEGYPDLYQLYWRIFIKQRETKGNG